MENVVRRTVGYFYEPLCNLVALEGCSASKPDENFMVTVSYTRPGGQTVIATRVSLIAGYPGWLDAIRRLKT